MTQGNQVQIGTNPARFQTVSVANKLGCDHILVLVLENSQHEGKGYVHVRACVCLCVRTCVFVYACVPSDVFGGPEMKL